MEVMLLKGPVVVKEEKRVERVADEESAGDIKKAYTMIASDRSSMESSPRPSSLTISQEDQLKSTKAEMGEVREENERLKMILARIAKDYQSLEMQFFDIVQQEQAKKPIQIPPSTHEAEERELVSLSLGTSSSWQKKELEKIITSKSSEDDKMEKGLTLGLDCKYEGSCSSPNEPRSNMTPDNSFEEPKEEEAEESLPLRKTMKNSRNVEDEVSQQTHVKKARVSVRARCDTPTMNDGCQWRKYGQKIAKGNPCPRAYYRCTVAPSCPVRKQVQRCQEDMSILITTYEGSHNHPLPISATAMASTTSAAACMLMSGSSTSSRPSIGSPLSSTTATTIAAANANLHGLNFGLPDNSRPRQFYLPNPTISSSLSHPTITLDLTAPPPSSSSSSTSQQSQFNRFSSAFTSSTPRYSPTSFNFSSSECNSIPTSWNLNYGTQPYNRGHIGQSRDPFYQSYLQNTTTNPAPTPTQHSLTDTIAKAITSDPSFQSALASAITTYVGANANANTNGSEGGLKWGDHLSSVASQAINGCASSYLTRSTTSSSNPQQGNLMFLKPPLAFSTSKSASASPVDISRENIN